MLLELTCEQVKVLVKSTEILKVKPRNLYFRLYKLLKCFLCSLKSENHGFRLDIFVNVVVKQKPLYDSLSPLTLSSVLYVFLSPLAFHYHAFSKEKN